MLPHIPTSVSIRGTNSLFPDQTDPKSRRRPFSTWVKKLKNFKGGYSNEGSNSGSGKREKTLAKKRPLKKNNPYPESGRIGSGTQAQHRASTRSVSSGPSGVTSSTSLARTISISSTTDGHGRAPTAGGRSVAPTVSTTDHDIAHSIAAPSHGASSVAGTSRTANGGVDSRRGGDSTFSSPAPSVRSLTTTLTTIQSIPMGMGNHNSHSQNSHPAQHHSIHFNQPFPNTPASAIPAHLNPPSAAGAGQSGHPTTYNTATANGLLTDNASILTLASSSKRRRRRSLDTDASVRALAPSSLFGGSRESLPLSVLSATIDSGTGPSSSAVPPVPTTPGGAARSVAERASIYSVTGIGGTDRNSLYAGKTQVQQAQSQEKSGGSVVGADAASIRSGRLGHGRAESVNGSLGVTSPLTSPREDSGEEEKAETTKADTGDKLAP